LIRLLVQYCLSQGLDEISRFHGAWI
jgi:hypothetical protein